MIWDQISLCTKKRGKALPFSIMNLLILTSYEPTLHQFECKGYFKKLHYNLIRLPAEGSGEYSKVVYSNFRDNMLSNSLRELIMSWICNVLYLLRKKKALTQKNILHIIWKHLKVRIKI